MEAQGPLSLTKWTDEDLGESVKTGPGAEHEGRPGPSDNGERWPALKVSGEPSFRAFQSSFIQIELCGADEDNLVYTIEGFLADEDELTLSAGVAGTAPRRSRPTHQSRLSAPRPPLLRAEEDGDAFDSRSGRS